MFRSGSTVQHALGSCAPSRSPHPLVPDDVHEPARVVRVEVDVGVDEVVGVAAHRGAQGAVVGLKAVHLHGGNGLSRLDAGKSLTIVIWSQARLHIVTARLQASCPSYQLTMKRSP